MKKHWFIIILFALLINIGIGIWAILLVPKVAYVRSGELVNKFLGMKEAKELFNKKKHEWEANFAVLENDLNTLIEKYQKDSIKLNANEQIDFKVKIMKAEENLIKYSNSVQEKAEQENQKLTEGILNQVNAFVEVYGKNNGYSVILGTTASGNLMYAKQGLDITEEVLLSMNQQYRGK